MLFAFAAESVHENCIAIIDDYEDIENDDDDGADDDDNCDVKNGQLADDVWVVL